MKKLLSVVGLMFLSLCPVLKAQTSAFLKYSNTTTGSSKSVYLIGTGTAYHQITWNDTGTVSACTVAVDSSPDGVTWTAGGVISGQTCTSNGSYGQINSVVNYIRITFTALSGGGTVTVAYTGALTKSGGGTISQITSNTLAVTNSTGPMTDIEGPQLLCRATTPILHINPGDTNFDQVTYACTIPAGLLGTAGHLTITGYVTPCNGTLNTPYTGCAASVNTGTCSVRLYLASTNIGTDYGLQVGGSSYGGTVATKSGRWTIDLQMQASASAELADGYNEVNNGGGWNVGQDTHLAGTVNTANTTYLNVFASNSVATDGCGIEQLNVAYKP